MTKVLLLLLSTLTHTLKVRIMNGVIDHGMDTALTTKTLATDTGAIQVTTTTLGKEVGHKLEINHWKV